MREMSELTSTILDWIERLMGEVWYPELWIEKGLIDQRVVNFGALPIMIFIETLRTRHLVPQRPRLEEASQ